MDALGVSENIGRGLRVSVRQTVFLIAVSLCAAIYPSILRSSASAIAASGLSAAAGIALATIFALLAASVVTSVSFFAVKEMTSPLPRILCHLAFTTPTLVVAIGNFAGVFGVRGAVTVIWLMLWSSLLAAALIFQKPRSESAILSPRARSRLAGIHGISACLIIALFIAPHLSNHVTGLWSGATHIALMKVLRNIYRNKVVEPVLFGLIAFQILSGLTLVGNRIGRRDTVFGTLQTLTGVYVAVFFLGHVTAVLAARHAGTDTNWNWLTDNDRGLLANLHSITLVGHYWVGPIAILTHIACGFRTVLLQNRTSVVRSNRVAIALMGLAMVTSSAILAGLIGIHLG